MDDQCGKRTARLVLHYLMETGSEDLCLAFAQDSAHLADEAAQLQCGEYAEPLVERLEQIIADYYEMCALVLRAIHRLTLAQKRPLAKMQVVGKLQYLLGSLTSAAVGTVVMASGATKRRSSMYADVRQLAVDEEEEEEEEAGNENNNSFVSEQKRRRLDQDVNISPTATTANSDHPLRTTAAHTAAAAAASVDHSSLSTQTSSTRAVEHSLLRHQEETQKTEPNERVAGDASAKDSNNRISSPVTTAAPPQTPAAPQFDLPSCTDRPSLGAHLSPIASASVVQPVHPFDSMCLALLGHEEFQEQLAANINKCIVLPDAAGNGELQQEEQKQAAEKQRLAVQMEAAVQNILEITEQNPLLDDIINSIVEASKAPPPPPMAATAAENPNQSIPGQLTASTPQKNMTLMRQTASNDAKGRGRRRQVEIGEFYVVGSEIEINPLEPPPPRVLRRRNTKKAQTDAAGNRTSSRLKEEKRMRNVMDHLNIQKDSNQSQQSVELSNQVGAEPTVRVNIIANESYQGAIPNHLDYYMVLPPTEPTPSQPLPPTPTPKRPLYELTAAPTPIPPSPSVNTQKLVIKPPAGCHYPMFSTTPIAVPVPVEQQKVEYIIALPTPQKDTNNDGDITIGDSLSKLLIPHSTKRYRSPRSRDESDPEVEGEKLTETSKAPTPTAIDDKSTEKPANVSTDKENSVPRVISQTPKLTSIVNQKVKCSSTPRKRHVRVLFNTPGKGTNPAVQSPRFHTLAKMDGIPQVTTPVVDRLPEIVPMTRSAVLRRSASKEATVESSASKVATVEPSKETSTPRVPKTIKKRILSGLREAEEKKKREDEEGEKKAEAVEVIVEKTSTKKTPIKANTPPKKKKPSPQKVKTPPPAPPSPPQPEKPKESTASSAKDKERSVEKKQKSPTKSPAKTSNSSRPPTTVTVAVKKPKVSKKKVAAVEEEEQVKQPPTDLDRWRETMKVSMSKDWENEVRLQMSRLPKRRRERRVRKKRVVVKKKVSGSSGSSSSSGSGKETNTDDSKDGEEELKVGEDKEIVPQEKVNDTLDVELQKFLNISGDASKVDTTMDQSTLNDTTTGRVDLLSLNGTVGGLPNLDASHRMPGDEQLPNLNPCTPGPVSAPPEPKAITPPVTVTETAAAAQTITTTTTIGEQSKEPERFLSKETATVTDGNTLPVTAQPVIFSMAPTDIDTDEHLTRALSPKKRMLLKSRKSEAKQLQQQRELLEKQNHHNNISSLETAEPSSNRPSTIINRSNTFPPPNIHISPPPPTITTTTTTCTSLDVSRNVTSMSANDSLLFLETPFKQGCDLVPKTPGFAVPHATPAAKIVKTIIDQHQHHLQMSVLKCSEIPTPDFAITPGVKLTPPEQQQQQQQGVDSAGKVVSYGKRPTDYSSSSSYYKPEDSEENRLIESRLAEQLLMQSCSRRGGGGGGGAAGEQVTVAVAGSTTMLSQGEEEEAEREEEEEEEEQHMVMTKTVAANVLEELEREARRDEEEEEVKKKKKKKGVIMMMKRKMRRKQKGVGSYSSDESTEEEGEIELSRSSAATSSSESSSYSTDSSSDSSQLESANEMEMGEERVLEKTKDKKRFVGGGVGADGRIEETENKVENQPLVGVIGGRKALPRQKGDAALFSDLAEKKRRMSEKLKSAASSSGEPVRRAAPLLTLPRSSRSQQAMQAAVNKIHNKSDANSKQQSVGGGGGGGNAGSGEMSVEKVPPLVKRTALQQKLASSAGKRKTSTPCKVMFLSDLPLTKTPQRGTVGREEGTVEVVKGPQVDRMAAVRPVITSSAMKRFDSLFGDISDSETDPTPVKRDDRDVFKTPKVDDKYQKVAPGGRRRVSDERQKEEVVVAAAVESCNKKSGEISMETATKSGSKEAVEKQNDCQMKNDVEKEQSEMQATPKPAIELEKPLMGPPEVSSTRRSSLPLHASEGDLRTPEAQIVRKKSLEENTAVVVVESGEATISSTTPSSSRAGSRIVKKIVDATKTRLTADKPPLLAPPLPPLKATAKPARKAIITLAELPNEGALRKTTRGAANNNKKTAAIVRKKAETTTIDGDGEKPAKKTNAVRAYLAKSKEAKAAAAAAAAAKVAEEPAKVGKFKIPKKNAGGAAAEEGEIVEESSCPVVVDRVSEIPEEEATASSSVSQKGSSQEGNKKTKSTSKMDEVAEEAIRSSSRMRIRPVTEKQPSTVKKSTNGKRVVRKKSSVAVKVANGSKKATAAAATTPETSNGNDTSEEKAKAQDAVDSKVAAEKDDDPPLEEGEVCDEVGDSGSEITLHNEMVSFHEDSSNFFHFVHDPNEPPQTEPFVMEENWDPKRERIHIGAEYFAVTLSAATELFSAVPGSNSSRLATLRESKQKRSCRTTQTASPKITLPKMDSKTVTTVLDFLHPKGD